MNNTQNATEGAAIMATKAAQTAAVSLATIASYQALVVGLLLDLIVNTTVAYLLFLEHPKEWTVSARLTRQR